MSAWAAEAPAEAKGKASDAVSAHSTRDCSKEEFPSLDKLTGPGVCASGRYLMTQAAISQGRQGAVGGFMNP